MDFEDADRDVAPVVALISILGFWLFYAALVSLRAMVMGFPAQGEMAFRRGIVTLIGIVVTWVLYLVLRQFKHASLSQRIAVAFAGAVPCAIAMAVANYFIFYFYDPGAVFIDAEMKQLISEEGMAMKQLAEDAIGRYFFLAAWAALYLALSYAAEARRVERRAARLERAAQQAELRSLRYQVNPHFLFNTLNSLSSLVMRSRNEEAEQMIMSLSNFYRTSLAGDPLEDVPLSEEVQLQKLYLDIEGVRFPDRLRTDIQISPELMNCCVPGLILQPLVENSIKYGVSRTTRPVTIHIAAQEEMGRLRLMVSDDGDMPPGDADKGNGIGLANVRDRLHARFGEDAEISWHPVESGGFMVDMNMPIVRKGC